MQQSEHERLVLVARTELEAMHGGRAIQAEEQPHDPTGGPHLSWMLARSLQLWKAGNINHACRWLGHVEGVLAAMKERPEPAKAVGAVREAVTQLYARRRDFILDGFEQALGKLLADLDQHVKSVEPSGSPMNEQEQRVWAATFAGLLAANEPANHALSHAYQAAQLVRDYSRAQGFEVGAYYPKGWAPPER